MGIAITRDWAKHQLCLSQRQYIVDMLSTYGFTDCSPVQTPMLPGTQPLSYCPCLAWLHLLILPPSLRPSHTSNVIALSKHIVIVGIKSLFVLILHLHMIEHFPLFSVRVRLCASNSVSDAVLLRQTWQPIRQRSTTVQQQPDLSGELLLQPPWAIGRPAHLHGQLSCLAWELYCLLLAGR